MIRNLQRPLSSYISNFERMLQPANYPAIQQQYARQDAAYTSQYMRNYLASLKEDLFDGSISSKKDELLHDIASSDITDGVKDVMIVRVLKKKEVEEFYQLLRNPFNFFAMLIRTGKLFGGLKAWDRVSDDAYKMQFLLLKFFSRNTNNPEIIRIREELSRLGIKDAVLGDNVLDAVDVLNGVRKAAAYGDDLPKQLVVSEVQEAGVLGETLDISGGPLMQISGRKFTQSIENYLTQRRERLSRQFPFNILPEDLREKLFLVIDDKMRPANNSIEFTVLHEHGHVNSIPEVLSNELELEQKYVDVLMNLTQKRPLYSEGFPELYGKARLFGARSLSPIERELFLGLGGKL